MNLRRTDQPFPLRKAYGRAPGAASFVGLFDKIIAAG
jgi:hypothetical protein